jgi:hypothetical protein
MIPNYLADVQAAKLKHAEAWSHAHVHGDPRRLEWITLFAKDLHAKDPNCNLNGKRGNSHDLSADAINILCDAADSAGRTPEGLPCVVVDVIGGAGGPNPVPTWSVYKTLVEGSGASVDPTSTSSPQRPQPPHKPYPGDQVWDGVGAVLFADYAAAGQAPNPQMGRWFGRTIWDATAGDAAGNVLTVEDSIKKHRAEWKAALGLP